MMDLCVEFLYLWVSRGRKADGAASVSIMSRLAVSVRISIMLGM